MKGDSFLVNCVQTSDSWSQKANYLKSLSETTDMFKGMESNAECDVREIGHCMFLIDYRLMV